MFQLLNLKRDVDFMSIRRPMAWLSLVLVIGSLVLVGVRGLNMGLDFSGGTLVEVEFSKAINLNQLRATLADNQFGEASVQAFGSSRDVLVRLPPLAAMGDSAASLNNKISDVLNTVDTQATIMRTEFVGPVVGAELMESAILAMLVALICILLYVGLRFEWRLAGGAVIALFHDVSIVFGFYSLTQMEFDLTTVAGVLSVIGYSLNDTIVVFDRVRENFRKIRKATELEVVNASLTQTLSRTLITSGTTLVVLIALYFAGGELLKTFAASLLIGIGVGTYSSIYIASSAALAMGLNRESLLPEKVEKEGADQKPLM